MKSLWTRRAFHDRDRIYTHIDKDNPEAAFRLDLAFDLCVERLSSHPLLGRPGRVAGTRELVVHPNYIIVYQVVGDTLRILRIMHAAQKWPPSTP